MPTDIKRLDPGGDVRKDWRTTNQLVDGHAAHARVLSVPADGRRQVYGGVGSGWRFAGTIEYDPDTQYARNQIVVVSPANAALDGVTDGVDGHGPSSNKALAGLYVCLKPPRVTTGEGEEAVTVIHVPIWEPPDGDPDSENNYWWLISLYPQVVERCVDGVPTLFYAHEQQVPEEFLPEE